MRPSDSAWMYLAATTLVLFAPFAAALHANHYPLASGEVLLVLSGCAAAGGLVGLAARSARPFAALLLGAMAAVSIDLLYDLGNVSRWLPLLLPPVFLVLAWFLRRNVALILLVASSVLLATTLVVPPTSAVQSMPALQDSKKPLEHQALRLPVILHLILDEHSGIDGLPKDLPGGQEFARWLTDFYVQRRFRVYTGAYSEYADTHEAIPNLLNFASNAQDRPYLLKGKSRPYQLTDSTYFALLSELGYRLHIYQSDYMDYCHVPGVSYASCRGYSAHDIGALHGTDIDTAERAEFIFNTQLERSQYVIWARQYYERARASFPQLPLPAWALSTSRVGPIPVLPVFEQLARDLRASSGGQVYFAHLLMPHYPYLLDSACQVRPEVEDWLYALPILPEEGKNWRPERLLRYLRSGRAQRYQGYFEQIRCQQTLLDRLLDSLTQAGLDANAVIIVQGDHGSRIVRRPILNWDDRRLSPEDFGDAYSTLFAVRCPGFEPGATRGYRPLQQLLSEVLGFPFTDTSHKVYLRQGDGTKKIAALPEPQTHPANEASAGSCLPGVEQVMRARLGVRQLSLHGAPGRTTRTPGAD